MNFTVDQVCELRVYFIRLRRVNIFPLKKRSFDFVCVFVVQSRRKKVYLRLQCLVVLSYGLRKATIVLNIFF